MNAGLVTELQRFLSTNTRYFVIFYSGFYRIKRC